MDKETARKLIDAAEGRISSDLVIRNANVVDVFNKNSFRSDVYIKDGYIVGFEGERKAENEYDAEAIQVLLPVYGKVGYIANSPYTVAKGTLSAGRAYDQVKKKFYIRVLYICTNQIICKVEEGRKEDMESRISRQLKAIDDTEF